MEKQTLGQAIDQAIQALEPLDESARKTALVAVCAHLSIDMVHEKVSGSAGTTVPLAQTIVATTAVTQAKVTRMDIRSLKEAKKPVSAKQMACLVAYFLQEHAPEEEKKDAISAADLEKYFKQAGFKLPSHLRQVLPDAKASGYFDSAARGEYKLNAVGYNLVVHNLPTDVGGN